MTRLIAPFATGPTPLYWVTNFNSDLSAGGAQYNTIAGDDNYPPPFYTPGLFTSLTLTAAAAATVEGRSYTQAGIPGTTGATGNYTMIVRMDPTVVDANVNVSFYVLRYNAAGFVQANSAPSAEQVSTAASVLIFSLTAISLGTWSAGDRLAVALRARNTAAHGPSRSVQFNLGRFSNTPAAPGITSTTSAVVSGSSFPTNANPSFQNL